MEHDVHSRLSRWTSKMLQRLHSVSTKCVQRCREQLESLICILPTKYLNFCGPRGFVSAFATISLVGQSYSATSLFLTASRGTWYRTSMCFVRFQHTSVHLMHSWLSSYTAASSVSKPTSYMTFLRNRNSRMHSNSAICFASVELTAVHFSLYRFQGTAEPFNSSR